MVECSFNYEESMHLNFIEERIRKIAKKKGLIIEEMKGCGVRGRKEWLRGIDFQVDREWNSIYFEVYYDKDKGGEKDKPKYRVFGGGEYHDSLMFGVKQLVTNDLEEAIEKFHDLTIMSEGIIPKELMIQENLWFEEPSLIPKGYEKEIPILSTVKIMRLYRNRNLLEVKRTFHTSDMSEGTTITYHGRILNELLMIKNGKITFISNNYSDRKIEQMRRRLGIKVPRPEDDINEHLEYFFGGRLPKPKRRTYHQIKTFKEKLRELPKIFQEDLKAVYGNSGIFN